MNKERFYAFIPRTTTHSSKLNLLPVTTRWLYVVMIAERGHKGKSFKFTYIEIEKITGFSSTTIRQGIKLLERDGFLRYEHGGLERNPNEYQLEESWLEI